MDSYPSIRLVAKNGVAFNYEGGWDSKSYEKYIEEMREPMFTPVKESQIDNTLNVYFVIRAPLARMQDFETFLSIYKGKKELHFFYVESASEEVEVHREHDVIPFTETASTQNLRKFVDVNRFSFFPQLDEGHRELKRANKFVGVVLDPLEHSDEIDTLNHFMRNLVIDKPKEYMHMKRYTVVNIDPSKEKHMLGKFTEPDTLPPYVFYLDGADSHNEKYFKRELDQADVAKSLSDFIFEHSKGLIKLIPVEKPKEDL